MPKPLQRIGVLTGGGDCPGLNAVLRAIVKAAKSLGETQVIGILDGYHGLIQRQVQLLFLQDVSGIISRGGTILGTTNRDNPFRFQAEGQGGFIDVSDRVLENIRGLELEALIVIGGDGTLSIAHELFLRGAPIIGIPKTIDNDLSATDVSFGFDTAVGIATEAIDRLQTTGESHHRVMVTEVMGRNTGWIALESGLAGGVDAILIPEIPYNMDRVCQHIESRKAEGKRFSLVVVAEGALSVGGKAVVNQIVPTDGSQPERLGGVGNLVGQGIEARTGVETRITVLGHIQRGGSPSPFDRILATRYGVAAVELAAKRVFGQMVSLQCGEMTSVPLEQAVRRLRLVPADGNLVATARRIGIRFGD